MMAQAAQHSVQQASQPDALAVFTLRAEARAILVAHGLMTLHEAVDGLQEAAQTSGLIQDLGQDAVQAMMAAAFEPWVEFIRR